MAASFHVLLFSWLTGNAEEVPAASNASALSYSQEETSRGWETYLRRRKRTGQVTAAGTQLRTEGLEVGWQEWPA